MRDYKEWTAKERLASLKKTKAAIAAGVIPPPTKCNRCGRETGRIDYHNHDYSDPVKHLEPLCQGCHTKLHRLENKEAATNVKVEKKSSVGAKADDRQVMNPDLNSWLEEGMKLSPEKLALHVLAIPAGVKPLHALRGLAIVFCNGYTNLYDSPGYPQTSGVGKNRAKFDVVLDRIRFFEKQGESLKVKGMPLSKKLESNYANNKE